MIVVSWNIQWGRGLDGRVDLQRIVDSARALGDFDVLCLQEVADNYPGLEGAARVDQFAELARLLPGFTVLEGIAVERHTPGCGRQRFGNLLATRAAPTEVLRHHLPWPADPGQPTMPRAALEAVLPTGAGPLRVLTTHLEYYSAPQRLAQLQRLRELQAEACGHAADQPHPRKAGGPFERRRRGAAAVLCGDFNADAGNPAIAAFQQPIAGASGWRDAWTVAHPVAPRAPTVGVHDDADWHAGRPQCFDYFFVSDDLAPHVRRLEVGSATQASDHQPVLLELDIELQAVTQNS